MAKGRELVISRAVESTISSAQARKLGAAASDAFADRVRGDRCYSDLLSRLYAQAERTLSDVESRNLDTKERAQVLATVARVLPQLQAAEQNWQMALNQRSIASLTGRELRDIVRSIDSDESQG